MTDTTPQVTSAFRVFLCYRRIDGQAIAELVFRLLQERLPEGAAVEAYFDQTSPAVDDWHEIHQPALTRCQCFVLIITPGIKHRVSRDDYAFQEISWWIKHGGSAPVLIDATGEGDRWIPSVIQRRWPNAQRIELSPKLQGDDVRDREAAEERLVQRLWDGVVLSRDRTHAAEIVRARRRNAVLTAIVAVLLVAVGTAVWQWRVALGAENRAKHERERAREETYRACFANARIQLSLDKPSEALHWLRKCPEDHREWIWRHLALRLDSSLLTLVGHRSAVRAVAFDPTGKRLCSGSDDGEIRIWNTTSGECLRSLSCPEGVCCVEYDDSGRWLAAGCDDGSIHVWELGSGGSKVSLVGFDGAVRTVAFDSSSDRLIGGGADGRAIVWDLGTRSILAMIETGEGSIYRSAFLPDAGHVLLGGQERLTVWSLDTGESLGEFGPYRRRASASIPYPHGYRLLLRRTSDPDRLYAGQPYFSVTMEPGSRSILSRAEPSGLTSSLKSALVPCAYLDSKMVTGLEDRTARIWSMRSGDLLGTLSGHAGQVTALDVDPGHTMIASGSDDRTIKLWDPLTQPPATTLFSTTDSIHSVAFASDRELTLVLSGTEAGRFRILTIDLTTGALLRDVSSDPVGRVCGWHVGGASSHAVPGRNRVLVSQPVCTILLDADTGAILYTIPAEEHWVDRLIVHPSGDSFALLYEDGAEEFFDLESGEVAEPPILTDYGQLFGRAATGWARFSFEDGLLSITGTDGSICTLQLEGSLKTFELSPHEDRLAVHCLVSSRSETQVYSLPSGDLISSIPDQGSGRMAFSVDGRVLFTDGATVQAWNPVDGTEMFAFPRDELPEPEHEAGSFWGIRNRRPDNVQRIVVSPDGERVVVVWKPSHRVPGVAVEVWDSQLQTARGMWPQRALHQTVDWLFDNIMIIDEIKPWVENHPRYSRDKKDELLRMIEDHGPLTLDQVMEAAGRIVGDPARGRGEYSSALGALSVMAVRSPASATLLHMLGAANYRAGNPRLALVSLLAAQSANQEVQEYHPVLDAAYLAMVHATLGNEEKVEASIRAAVKALRDDPMPSAAQIVDEAIRYVEKDDEEGGQ